MVFAGELPKTKCCVSTEVAGREKRLIKTRRSRDGHVQQTVIFQNPACLFQLDRVSKTYSCPFISFSGNLSFPIKFTIKTNTLMYFKRLVSFQMHTNPVFNSLRLIETSTQSLLHPEGATPRKFGWGCEARFLYPIYDQTLRY